MLKIKFKVSVAAAKRGRVRSENAEDEEKKSWNYAKLHMIKHLQ